MLAAYAALVAGARASIKVRATDIDDWVALACLPPPPLALPRFGLGPAAGAGWPEPLRNAGRMLGALGATVLPGAAGDWARDRNGGWAGAGAPPELREEALRLCAVANGWIFKARDAAWLNDDPAARRTAAGLHVWKLSFAAHQGQNVSRCGGVRAYPASMILSNVGFRE